MYRAMILHGNQITIVCTGAAVANVFANQCQFPPPGDAGR